MFAAEALANTIGGGLINWAVTWLLLGFTPAQSLGITALFFGISFARSYVLRHLFNALDTRRRSRQYPPAP